MLCDGNILRSNTYIYNPRSKQWYVVCPQCRREVWVYWTWPQLEPQMQCHYGHFFKALKPSIPLFNPDIVG